MSVAALAIAISSYGQSVQYGVDSIEASSVSLEAKSQHENLYEIVIRAEDMITMLDEDVYNGHMQEYYSEFYNELLNDIIKLASTLDIDSVVNEVYKYEGLRVE